MEQIKIGKFIAEQRKIKNLTQRELADILQISDKTVSKWETGKGLPEVSLMMPLCKTLGINVNELLSGEKIEESDYKEKAEEVIMNLVKEKEESKRSIFLSAIITLITLLGSLTIMMLTSYLAAEFNMELWLTILLFVIAVIILVGGIYVVCVLDYNAGTYECRKCGKRFVPTMREYVMAPHTITTRQLKCPHCGEKSYCKRRLTH